MHNMRSLFLNSVCTVGTSPAAGNVAGFHDLEETARETRGAAFFLGEYAV